MIKSRNLRPKGTEVVNLPPSRRLDQFLLATTVSVTLMLLLDPLQTQSQGASKLLLERSPPPSDRWVFCARALVRGHGPTRCLRREGG